LEESDAGRSNWKASHITLPGLFEMLLVPYLAIKRGFLTTSFIALSNGESSRYKPNFQFFAPAIETQSTALAIPPRVPVAASK
jgi:hypothetical protein